MDAIYNLSNKNYKCCKKKLRISFKYGSYIIKAKSFIT